MADVTRTLDVPVEQRFDFWKATLAESFVPLEVTRPGNSADFRGELTGFDLGTVRMREVKAGPHTALRTRRLVSAAPSGCYKLGLMQGGSAVLTQDGREAVLGPGDFALYDTDRPYTLDSILLIYFRKSFRRWCFVLCPYSLHDMVKGFLMKPTLKILTFFQVEL